MPCIIKGDADHGIWSYLWIYHFLSLWKQSDMTINLGGGEEEEEDLTRNASREDNRVSDGRDAAGRIAGPEGQR